MPLPYEELLEIKLCFVADDPGVYRDLENALGATGFREEHFETMWMDIGVLNCISPSGFTIDMQLFYLHPVWMSYRRLLKRYLWGSFALVLFNVAVREMEFLLENEYHVPLIITNEPDVDEIRYPNRIVKKISGSELEFFGRSMEEIFASVSRLSVIECETDGPIAFCQILDLL